jgi:hypothetical protein
MKKFVVLTFSCVLTTACSPAQTQKGSARAAANEERVTCWYEKPTGTRVKVKVCGTDSERAMALQDDRSLVDDLERQRSADEAKPGPAMLPRP